MTVLRVAISGLEELIAREIEAGDRAIERGTVETIQDLKAAMRRQSVLAGLRKVARSWQDKTRRAGADSGGIVFTRARKIMRLAEEGGVVRPKSGRFLAIPTKAAPKIAGPIPGTRVRAPVRTVSGKKNVRFIFTHDGRKGLVVRSTRTRSTILYFLVPRTRHRKTIDFAGAAERAQRALAPNILKHWPG